MRIEDDLSSTKKDGTQAVAGSSARSSYAYDYWHEGSRLWGKAK